MLGLRGYAITKTRWASSHEELRLQNLRKLSDEGKGSAQEFDWCLLFGVEPPVWA